MAFLENLEMYFTKSREKILSGKSFLKLFYCKLHTLYPYMYLVEFYSVLNIK